MMRSYYLCSSLNDHCQDGTVSYLVLSHPNQPKSQGQASKCTSYFSWWAGFDGTQLLNHTAVIFILILFVMIAQLFWVSPTAILASLSILICLQVCEPMPEWRSEVSPQCPLDKQVAICQLVSAYWPSEPSLSGVSGPQQVLSGSRYPRGFAAHFCALEAHLGDECRRRDSETADDHLLD